VQRNIQHSENPDAVYNWCPITLSPPPISIYHPVFAQFVREISNPGPSPLSSSELDDALTLIINFLDFYSDEPFRLRGIGQTRLFNENGVPLVQPTKFLRDSGKTFEPNGHRKSFVTTLHTAIPSEIIEVKNEIGEGLSDSITQAERDYVCMHSSPEVSSSDITLVLFTAQSLTQCYP
jgi:hypothetical protein